VIGSSLLNRTKEPDINDADGEEVETSQTDDKVVEPTSMIPTKGSEEPNKVGEGSVNGGFQVSPSSDPPIQTGNQDESLPNEGISVKEQDGDVDHKDSHATVQTAPIKTEAGALPSTGITSNTIEAMNNATTMAGAMLQANESQETLSGLSNTAIQNNNVSAPTLIENPSSQRPQTASPSESVSSANSSTSVALNNIVLITSTAAHAISEGTTTTSTATTSTTSSTTTTTVSSF
jgi:hypothetical protein